MAQTATPTPETTEIIVSRDIAARPERVFEIWTDPAQMLRWMGRNGVENVDAGFEPRAGGAWYLVLRRPDGLTFRIEGTNREFEPGKRILQSWCHVDAEGTRSNETEAEILFETTGSGCRVTIHHRNIRFTPDGFRDGWTESLDRLGALAAS